MSPMAVIKIPNGVIGCFGVVITVGVIVLVGVLLLSVFINYVLFLVL